MKKLQVWWIPQIPGQVFAWSVETVEQGVLLIDALSAYDEFQFANRIKPDYCNTGGLQQWCEEDRQWEDWFDDETGEDDPRAFLAHNAELTGVAADEVKHG